MWRAVKSHEGKSLDWVFSSAVSFGVYNEINKFAPVWRDEVTVGC